jgi:catechol 2,3-dioxygenase-like lactoylglutathione lyase family enzyme
MKFSSTRIVTSDVPLLAKFYEKITGIVPVGNEDFVQLETAGGILAISSIHAMERYLPGVGSPAANRSVILEFQVDDVDVERSRLESIVQNWVMEPKNQPWGNRSMVFRDPDGNLINFYAPITGGKQ